jgi:hypothetical protein
MLKIAEPKIFLSISFLIIIFLMYYLYNNGNFNMCLWNFLIILWKNLSILN